MMLLVLLTSGLDTCYLQVFSPHAVDEKNIWYTYMPYDSLYFDNEPEAIHVRTLAWDLAHCIGPPIMI